MLFRKRKQDERPSVDWMDFGKADGGPTRRVVDHGVRELESRRTGDETPFDADAGDEAPQRR